MTKQPKYPCAIFLLLFSVSVTAGQFQPRTEQDQPVIGIIIDDIGDRLKDGERAIDIPATLTYAFLPHTPYAQRLANRAYRQNKEIMLHLPMESESNKALGPGGLTYEMTHTDFETILRDNLQAIPHVRGISNHMGSLLTKHLLHMDWLMQIIASYEDLFFIDSRTTSESVAMKLARQHNIKGLSRDIFLDHIKVPNIINQQIDQLIDKARRKGFALGIAHPHPITMGVLETRLPKLIAQGIQLVPVSNLIARKKQKRNAPWHVSLSP